MNRVAKNQARQVSSHRTTRASKIPQTQTSGSTIFAATTRSLSIRSISSTFAQKLYPQTLQTAKNNGPSHHNVSQCLKKYFHSNSAMSRGSTTRRWSQQTQMTNNMTPTHNLQKKSNNLNLTFSRNSHIDTTRNSRAQAKHSRNFRTSAKHSHAVSHTTKRLIASNHRFSSTLADTTSKLPASEMEPFMPKEMQEFAKDERTVDRMLRHLFAKESNHPALMDNHYSLLNVYKEIDQFQRAKPQDGLPIILNGFVDKNVSGCSVAPTFKSFRGNWHTLTSNAFNNANLNWDNMLAAGGAVSAALMPRPSLRALDLIQLKKGDNDDLRKKLAHFYHNISPVSDTDVDLFLWGLTPAEAEKKIRYLHSAFTQMWDQGPLLTIRTENAITFVPKWPLRKVQVILRLYKSPSEILVGFDVDSCSVAFDGNDVWATSRAMRAFNRRYNLVDLERQSRTYELRLFKYAKRGFGVAIPGYNEKEIDWSRVCKTPLHQLKGLAKLLHLQEFDEFDQKKMYEHYFLVKSPKAFKNNVNIYEASETEAESMKKISDYESVFIPYGSKWSPEQIISLFEQRRNGAIAQMIADRRVEKPFEYRPNFMYSYDINDILGTTRPENATPQKETSWLNFLRIVPVESVDVHTACSLKSTLPLRIQWRENDPGSQLIGSFHPLREDWFGGARLSSQEKEKEKEEKEEEGQQSEKELDFLLDG